MLGNACPDLLCSYVSEFISDSLVTSSQDWLKGCGFIKPGISAVWSRTDLTPVERMGQYFCVVRRRK